MHFVSDGMIITGDRMATNGVIHMIDRVLLPQRATLVHDLLRNLRLTSILGLIERSGMTSIFQSPEAFTIFAPSNLAMRGMHVRQNKK